MKTRLFLLAALSPGACTVGPAYQRPAAPAPAQWRDSATVLDTGVADLR